MDLDVLLIATPGQQVLRAPDKTAGVPSHLISFIPQAVFAVLDAMVIMKGFGALCLAAITGLVRGLASTDTVTWGGDNTRAGYFTNHNMDPAIVGSSQFGQVFRTALPSKYNGSPEQIFSQPLVYTPSGGGKQYVYWATTQNNVYKMDAKTGEIVASRNLHIPFLTADLDGCVDINPTVGVTATGVIDSDTDTLYLTAKTYIDQDAGPIAQGRPAGRYYVHALDVNDLSERPSFPVNLEGLLARNNPERMFTGGIHHQRPGLLHSGQFIYAGFASHCVQYNFTGWVIGWDKTTGKIVERWATEGEGVKNDVKGGGIWMSGGGLASDDAGSMFFATGNGYASQLSTIPVNGFNPPTSMEEAACHMTINDDGSLTLVDFFMPYEKQALDGADKDLGTSPLEILPGEFSCGDVKRMGVVTGKSGKTYWLNLDNLGGYRNGPGQRDAVIQTYQNENSVYAGAGVYPLEGGYIYINVIQYPSHVFKFSCNNGVPSFTKVADSPVSNAYILGVSHGTVTSLNGQEGTGLLWITDVQNTNFRIYDAVPKDGLLQEVKSFQITGITKFTRPVFGDGMVYIGTTQGYVYGYGSSSKSPLNCTSPIDFGTVDVSETSQAKTITCKALIDTTVSGIGLAKNEGSNFAVSDLPTLPLSLTADKTFTFQAKFAPLAVGILSDSLQVNTTTSAGAHDGYSGTTSIRLVGTGESSGALLAVSPKNITFTGIVVGQDPDGVTDSILLNNQGNATLTLDSVLFSTESADGPFETWGGSGSVTAGKFSLTGVPSTIKAGGSSVVTITFDSSTSGDFKAFFKFVSDGGNGTVSVSGAAGAAPVALVEFQTPDGQDWVTYKEGTPFTFGNVTENTSRSLKLRVTNSAPTGSVKLSITVSKPPFGVSGIIRAANQVDLAEGTSLSPGQSASAVLTCTAPKSQWNVDPYNGTAQWTMNTNDPKFDKQFMQFFCNAVAEQAPPLLPNGQGRYRYIGCFKEDNPGRQLQSQLYGDDESTNAMCIQACAGKKYTFCGTEYHRECWAGNMIPTLKVDGKNCNFDCSGDLNQICGGNGVDGDGSFISLFADSAQWDGNYTNDGKTGGGSRNPVVNLGVHGYVSIGCYTESTNGRALPNGKGNPDKNVASCIAACAAAKYTYAGLEYGEECWCGNSLTVGSVPAEKADECNMVCNGNATEYCGGPSRLNVYKREAANSSSSSFSSETTPTAATPGISGLTTKTSTGAASPTSSSPTGPVIQEKLGDWEFQGCWTEGDGVRALNQKTYAKDDMTLDSCAAFCEGFTYFGAEYGRECYCGNSLNKGSVKAENQRDCSFSCAGDGSQYCGAGNRLQLYMKAPSSGPSTPASATTRVSLQTGSDVPASSLVSSRGSDTPNTSTLSTAPSATTPGTRTSTATITTTATNSSASPSHAGPIVFLGNRNFTVYSCVSEPSKGRLLSKLIFNDGDNMTISACLERCWMYQYAGVEYGRECWCGDTLNLAGKSGATPGENVSDSQCNFKCPGDDRYWCGAGSRMNLYINNATSIIE